MKFPWMLLINFSASIDVALTISWLLLIGKFVNLIDAYCSPNEGCNLISKNCCRGNRCNLPTTQMMKVNTRKVIIHFMIDYQ